MRFLVLVFLFITFSVEASETFGIVTKLAGDVYVLKKDKKPALLRSLGTAVSVGDGLLVKEGSRLALTDRSGNEVSFVGLAEAEVTAGSLVEVSKGIVKVRAGKPRSLEIRSAGLSATTSGEGALWVIPAKTQWFTLKGSSQAWHPEHPVSRVEVTGGHFTESSSEKAHYLEPRRPKIVDEKSAEHFLAAFGEKGLEFVRLELPKIEEEKELETETQIKRDLAFVLQNAINGPQKPKLTEYEVSQEIKHEMIERLRAHIEGREYDPVAARKAREKAIDPETRKRMAEAAKRKARADAREAALSSAMKETNEVAPVRKEEKRGIASFIASEIEAEESGPKPQIIERLLKQGKAK